MNHASFSFIFLLFVACYIAALSVNVVAALFSWWRREVRDRKALDMLALNQGFRRFKGESNEDFRRRIHETVTTLPDTGDFLARQFELLEHGQITQEDLQERLPIGITLERAREAAMEAGWRPRK